MADNEGWSRLGSTPDGSAVYWAPVGTPLPDRSEYEGNWPLPEPCPECAQRKCGNCDGWAWDNERDEPTRCPCALRGHGK